MNARDRAARRELGYAPPITSTPDLEYATRIEAERCTAEFSQPLPAGSFDTGKQPIEHAPLFCDDDPQASLFTALNQVQTDTERTRP